LRNWSRSPIRNSTGIVTLLRCLPGEGRHPFRLAHEGRELAAILGAVLAARLARVPVLLDGFVCTAAAAPLIRLNKDALTHACVAHRSAEAGHGALLAALGQRPLLDLDLRLGEASGAALAVPILRAAVACHSGMASFPEAGVRDRA